MVLGIALMMGIVCCIVRRKYRMHIMHIDDMPCASG